MRTTIEIRHAESGLAKNFHSREDVIAFLTAEKDPDAWEGWQNLNIQLPEREAPAPAPAPTAAPAPAAAPKPAAKKTAPAKKASGKK